MAGASPGVRVLPVRVLGKCGGYDSDIIAGMRWAAGLTVGGVPANPYPRARVISLSLGGDGACSVAYQQAVDEIAAAGTLVVAAAGNSSGMPWPRRPIAAASSPWLGCATWVPRSVSRRWAPKSRSAPLEAIASIPRRNIRLPLSDPERPPDSGCSRCLVSQAYTERASNTSVGTSFAAPLAAAVAALALSGRSNAHAAAGQAAATRCGAAVPRRSEASTPAASRLSVRLRLYSRWVDSSTNRSAIAQAPPVERGCSTPRPS